MPIFSDPSEIILICWFSAQETLIIIIIIIIINAANHSAAYEPECFRKYTHGPRITPEIHKNPRLWSSTSEVFNTKQTRASTSHL